MKIEEFKKLLEQKRQELSEKDFDNYIDSFWTTKPKDIKKDIEILKLKLKVNLQKKNTLNIRKIELKLQEEKLRNEREEIKMNIKKLKDSI